MKMDVEILFMSSSKPKKIENVEAVFTKGELLCIRVGDMLLKYPLCNVFSVCHKHGNHWGSDAHLKGACNDSTSKKM
jgi:hypothetical protein